MSSLSIILSTAERRGTPLLLSASVCDNSGNSPQMAAPRRSYKIDQSMQCFHVGCDNHCLLGNKYCGLHGCEFLGRTSMIIILTNQAVFVTLSVVKIAPLAQNHADVIGDQSDMVTQNAWFLCTLCAAISGEININTNRGRVLGKVSCTKNLPLGEYVNMSKGINFLEKHEIRVIR